MVITIQGDPVSKTKQSTMEYYIAEKHNDTLNIAEKWMKLENIILSEVTQTQKDKYHMYSHICGFYR